MHLLGLSPLWLLVSAALVLWVQTPPTLGDDSVSINTNRINVTLFVNSSRNLPRISFQDIAIAAETYHLDLVGFFEAKAESFKQLSKINGTDVDLSSLEWQLSGPAVVNSSITVNATGSLPAKEQPTTNGSLITRFKIFTLSVSANACVWPSVKQSSRVPLLTRTARYSTDSFKISMANLSVHIQDFHWISADKNAFVVLLWRLASMDDRSEDTSLIQGDSGVASGAASLRIGPKAASADRTVLVRLQHVPLNSSTNSRPEGIWTCFEHFDGDVHHLSTINVGEPGGKGGRGGIQARSTAVTIGFIVASALLVTIIVSGFIYWHSWQKARKLAIVE